MRRSFSRISAADTFHARSIASRSFQNAASRAVASIRRGVGRASLVGKPDERQRLIQLGADGDPGWGRKRVRGHPALTLHGFLLWSEHSAFVTKSPAHFKVYLRGEAHSFTIPLATP